MEGDLSLVFPITDRATWLQLRSHDVTASEVGALFGFHKYLSPLQLWAAKSGRGRDGGDNIAMKRGRIFEPAIAAAVGEEHPDWDIRKSDHYYRHHSMKIGATPDYFRYYGDGVGAPREVIECKFVQPSVFEREWSDGPPLYYILQCLTQIYLTEARSGWIAAMVDNRAKDLHLYPVERNDAAWERVTTSVAKFWANVAQDQMPEADYSMDLAVLKTLMPPEHETPMDLTDSNRIPEILARREEVAEELKRLNAERETIDAEVVDALCGRTSGKAQGYSISHKTQKRKSYTVPESEFSVLRVTKTKEKEL